MATTVFCTVMSNGIYELTSFDLNNHFFDNMILIEKYNPEKGIYGRTFRR